MRLHTCSEVMTFTRKLENESAKFYEDLCQRWGQNGDVLLSFAKENKKNVTQIERAYYGVISDAIEGCFAFDIETDDYGIGTNLAQSAGYSNALDKAIEMEGKLIKFYSDAAQQSSSLLADVPRAFRMIAKKRESRTAKLGSLLQKKDY